MRATAALSLTRLARAALAPRRNKAMIAVIWWPMMEGFYNKWFGWGPGYRKKLVDKGPSDPAI